MLFVSLGANAWLFRMLVEAFREKLTDALALRGVMDANTTALTALKMAMEARTAASMEGVQAQRQTAQAVSGVSTAMSSASTEAARWRDDLRRELRDWQRDSEARLSQRLESIDDRLNAILESSARGRSSR